MVRDCMPIDLGTDVQLDVLPGVLWPRKRLKGGGGELSCFHTEEACSTIPDHGFNVMVDAWPPHKFSTSLLDLHCAQVTLVRTQATRDHSAKPPRDTDFFPARKCVLHLEKVTSSSDTGLALAIQCVCRCAG